MLVCFNKKREISPFFVIYHLNVSWKNPEFKGSVHNKAENTRYEDI